MKNIILSILKIILKLLLLCLWGIFRLAEMIFQQINIALQHFITKPTNSHHK